MISKTIGFFGVLAYFQTNPIQGRKFSAGPAENPPTTQPQQLFTWHECVTPNSSKEVRRDLRIAAMVFHCRLPGGVIVFLRMFFSGYAGKIMM